MSHRYGKWKAGRPEKKQGLQEDNGRTEPVRKLLDLALKLISLSFIILVIAGGVGLYIYMANQHVGAYFSQSLQNTPVLILLALYALVFGVGALAVFVASPFLYKWAVTACLENPEKGQRRAFFLDLIIYAALVALLISLVRWRTSASVVDGSLLIFALVSGTVNYYIRGPFRVDTVFDLGTRIFSYSTAVTLSCILFFFPLFSFATTIARQVHTPITQFIILALAVLFLIVLIAVTVRNRSWIANGVFLYVASVFVISFYSGTIVTSAVRELGIGDYNAHITLFEKYVKGINLSKEGWSKPQEGVVTVANAHVVLDIPPLLLLRGPGDTISLPSKAIVSRITMSDAGAKR